MNQTLVDLAAESVVRNILIEEDICDLPIPETLFPVVLNKFCDIEWVRSYWNSQPEPQLFSTTKSAQTLVEDSAQEVQEENLEEEEFLNAVIDDFTDDVQQIINNHIDGADENSQRRKDYPTGI